MSQMANLLKYFPEIDDGPSESQLKGVVEPLFIIASIPPVFSK